jgi:hypothetical protein
LRNQGFQGYLLSGDKIISISKRATIEHVDYLLRDWKSNIKNFDLVREDIITRIEANHETMLNKVWKEDKKKKEVSNG